MARSAKSVTGKSVARSNSHKEGAVAALSAPPPASGFMTHKAGLLSGRTKERKKLKKKGSERPRRAAVAEDDAEADSALALELWWKQRDKSLIGIPRYCAFSTGRLGLRLARCFV